MKAATQSEGTASALQILNAIGPLHGSERPDVGLSPYLLQSHSHARIDTSFMPRHGMAVSHRHLLTTNQPSKGNP